MSQSRMLDRLEAQLDLMESRIDQLEQLLETDNIYVDENTYVNEMGILWDNIEAYESGRDESWRYLRAIKNGLDDLIMEEY